MKRGNILLLDFDPAGILTSSLQAILRPAFALEIHSIEQTTGSPQFSKLLSGLSADMIFLILSSGSIKHTYAALQCIKSHLSTPIIAVVETAQPDEILDLLKLGAADFVCAPLKAADILPRIWRLIEQSRPAETFTRNIKEKLGLKQLIGKSPAFLEEIRNIPLMAKCDASVLVSGETGIGKELCARAIHYLSPRASKPFTPINCGAIPVELFENELFGHARGAFTGASSMQPGLIAEADGGTLFLDEIDCLPLLAQVKLLRFLQEKEYRPVGSPKLCRADVRIIAAANIDLQEAVATGRFRQDLFYRLNIVSITLSPLRQRREDIPLLANHFLAKYTAEFSKQDMQFSLGALEKLLSYEWPGNVRELEHVIERIVALNQHPIIQPDDIDIPCLQATKGGESFREAKTRVVEEFEKSYIEGLLITYKGNITKAAKASQKNRRAFWELIRKYKIDVGRFALTAS